MCRDGVRKANVAGAELGNGLYSYVSQERKDKKIFTPSMNMTGKLVRMDYEILKNLLPQSSLAISISTSSFKLKECIFSLHIMKKFFNEIGESLEQAPQGSCECPSPGNVNHQVGQDSEQQDLWKASLPIAGELD